MNLKPNKLTSAIILIAILISGAFAVKAYNGYRFHVEKQTRFMMDTYVTIYAVGPESKTSRAIGAALDRMQEVDEKFNMLNPRSPLYAFNHDGAPITDPEIIGVIRASLDVAKKTGGAFDITIEPLIELWGFYGQSPHLPQQGQIKEALSQTGYQYLAIKDGKVEKLKENIKIDLGGIAKGYGVGEAKKILEAKGVASALIDAGGAVYALGKRGKDLWKVGIRDPRKDGLLGYLEVEDLTVMGSGDYERFFMENGKKYHHIFNPKTGYPAEGVRGTTVVYKDPTLADAWSTAVFVLGAERGMEMVEKTPGLEAMIVKTSGEILYSSGLKDQLNHIQSTN